MAKYVVVITLLCGLLLFVQNAGAQTVTLAWDAVTTHTDGSPATNLAGYRIYAALAPIPDTPTTPPDLMADVPAPQTTTDIDISALANPGNTIYFRAKAYDTAGDESGFSNAVSLVVTTAPMLAAPVNLQCTAFSAGTSGIALSGCQVQ